MTSRLVQLNKIQNEIEIFFERAKRGEVISGADLRMWIIKTATHLVDLGVDTKIVEIFISSVDFQNKEDDISHGPFRKKIIGGQQSAQQGRRPNR